MLKMLKKNTTRIRISKIKSMIKQIIPMINPRRPAMQKTRTVIRIKK